MYDFERTGQPNTGLLPYSGFYHAFREPLVEDDRPYPFAPDLAVEVASPSQKQGDVDAKARRYLRGGTALVWVIWPDRPADCLIRHRAGCRTFLPSGGALCVGQAEGYSRPSFWRCWLPSSPSCTSLSVRARSGWYSRRAFWKYCTW